MSDDVNQWLFESNAQRTVAHHPDVEPAPLTPKERDEQNLFLEVPEQLGSSLIDAVNESINAVIDTGAGIPAEKMTEFFVGRDLQDSALTDEQKKQIESDAGLQAAQRVRKFSENYLELPEGPGPTRTAGVVTRELGKFIFKTVGFGKFFKSVPAGVAAAGFATDPEDESFDSLFEMLVDSAPNGELEDVKKFLDSPEPTDRLLQRALNGVEELATFAAGEVAFKTAAKVIPDEVKQKFLDALPNMSAKAFKAWLLAKKGGRLSAEGLEGFTKGRFEHGFTIHPNKKALAELTPEDLTGPINQEKIRGLIEVDYNPSARIPSEEAFNNAINGVKAQISEVFKERLKDLPRSRKAALKALDENVDTMARNIVFDATTLRLTDSYKAYQTALLVGDQAKAQVLRNQIADNTRDFLVTAVKKMEQDSAAGLALRAAQEASPLARSGLEALKKQGAEIRPDDVRKGIDDILAFVDSAGSDEFFANGSEAFALVKSLGASTEDIMNNFNRAAAKVGAGKSTARKIWDAFESSFVNGILSSPRTQVLNIAGNEAMLAMRAMDNAFLGVLGGQRMSTAMIYMQENLRRMGDAALLAANAGVAAARSRSLDELKINMLSQKEFLRRKGLLRDGVDVLSEKQKKSLMNTDRLSEFRGTPFSASAFNLADDSPLGRMINIAGATIGGGFVREGMRITDNIYKSVALRAETRRNIRQQIFDNDALGLDSLGLSGDIQSLKKSMADAIEQGGEVEDFTDIALRAGVPEKEAGRINVAALQVQKQTQESAIKEALEIPLQTELGPVGESARKLLQEQIPGARLIFTIFTTPTNIVKQVIDRVPVMPLGDQAVAGIPISPKFYKDFAAGGQRRADAMARFATGSTIYYMGMKMWKDGTLFIADEDPSTAKLQGELGAQRMSIIAGDDAYGGIAKLAPFSPILAAGASMQRSLDRFNYQGQVSDEAESEIRRVMTSQIMTIADVVMELPMLQQQKNITDALSRSTQDAEAGASKAGQVIGTVASGAIPLSSLLRFYNRLGEPILKNTRAADQKIADIFGQAEVPHYNALGEPVKRGVPTFFGTVLGKKKLVDDPVIRGILNAGFAPPPLRQQISIAGTMVELKVDEYKRMNEMFAKEINIRSRLRDIVNSSAYRASTRDVQRKMIKSEWNAAKGELRERMMLQFPRLETEAANIQGFKKLQDLRNDADSSIQKLDDIIQQSTGGQ